MSTLKVTNIQHPSAADPAIELDANGGALIGGQAAYARNLLYNGAMQVHQRGTSTASITTTGYYTADRWSTVLDGFGTWTQTIENDAPTGSGFVKSLKMLCTTADSTPAAGDFGFLTQRLEGQDIQRVAKGTSSAKQLTLSFWVKSNVTGTYVTNLRDIDNSRQVSASYSISASATWEKKTITFPADTTGAFDNDNAHSFSAQWWFGAGSNRTSGTLRTTWTSETTADLAVGQTNLAAATNNYWQITGVQLEVGPAATPFEFKSYGQELAECQRYYYRTKADTAYSALGNGQCTGTTAAAALTVFPIQMRTNPTALEQTGTAANYAVTSSIGNIVAASGVPTFDSSVTSRDRAYSTVSVASGLTAGNATSLIANNNTTAYLAWSAEL